GAGRERPLVAGDHEAAHRLVAVEGARRLGQLLERGLVQRVAPLGAVDAQQPDAALEALDAHVLVGALARGGRFPGHAPQPSLESAKSTVTMPLAKPIRSLPRARFSSDLIAASNVARSGKCISAMSTWRGSRPKASA